MYFDYGEEWDPKSASTSCSHTTQTSANFDYHVSFCLFQTSGLSKLLAETFSVLQGLPPGIVALVITIAIAAGTEVTSNAATASIFLPIIGQMVWVLFIQIVRIVPFTRQNGSYFSRGFLWHMPYITLNKL